MGHLDVPLQSWLVAIAVLIRVSKPGATAGAHAEQAHGFRPHSPLSTLLEPSSHQLALAATDRAQPCSPGSGGPGPASRPASRCSGGSQRRAVSS